MLMIKILLVEDDPALLELYGITLRRAGYHTLLASNGQEAWEILEKEYIDLMITDIMMPFMDGYELVSLFRRENPRLPVLMITAKDDFPSKNRGFSLGADDYMVKPINVDEMVLRVQALLRRAGISSEHRLTVGDTVMDYDSMSVTAGSSPVTLPQKEFLLLFQLLSYPGKIFTRMQLMDQIWGRNSTSDLQTIDVHINRLRRRFENNRDFEIVTIRGLGYKAVIR